MVAAVIRGGDGRLLVGRRPSHKRHGGLWEFPGGKLDPGESLVDAARRELLEELELTLVRAAPTPVFEARDPGQPFRILFLEVEVEGEPVLHEHEALAWIEVPPVPGYVLAPSDGRFVAAVADGSVALHGVSPDEV